MSFFHPTRSDAQATHMVPFAVCIMEGSVSQAGSIKVSWVVVGDQFIASTRANSRLLNRMIRSVNVAIRIFFSTFLPCMLWFTSIRVKEQTAHAHGLIWVSHDQVWTLNLLDAVLEIPSPPSTSWTSDQGFQLIVSKL